VRRGHDQRAAAVPGVCKSGGCPGGAVPGQARPNNAGGCLQKGLCSLCLDTARICLTSTVISQAGGSYQSHGFAWQRGVPAYRSRLASICRGRSPWCSRGGHSHAGSTAHARVRDCTCAWHTKEEEYTPREVPASCHTQMHASTQLHAHACQGTHALGRARGEVSLPAPCPCPSHPTAPADGPPSPARTKVHTACMPTRTRTRAHTRHGPRTWHAGRPRPRPPRPSLPACSPCWWAGRRTTARWCRCP